MRIAVTRHLDQLHDLQHRAATKNIEIVPLPLMEVKSINFAWPDEIDLNKLGWIFFTSANGVDAFFKRLDNIGCKLSKQAKCAVVGRKTEEALNQRGYDSSFQPSEAYGHLLFSEFIEHHPDCRQTLVYARAKEVDYDPQQFFAARKFDFHEVICYESVECAPDVRAFARIKREDAILFTAPSMVRAFHRHFGDPEARLLAIGHTTAAEMDRHRWSNYTVLKHADVNSVLEYI
ncbi:MAG: uroporphyrinogen-III synthase [Candidatus Zixiibacteriota bacterium]